MTGTDASGRIPPFQSSGGERLPGEARGYLNLRTILDVIVISGALGAASFILLPLEMRAIALASELLFFGILTVYEFQVINRLRMQYTTYSVDASQVQVARGKVFRRVVTISTAQILNIEIRQGPLLRHFGLVKVKFICIADVETLGPVSVTAAEAMRHTILRPLAVAADA
jgi:membrane protein YdbS with pleckstrin-like domain